MLSEKEFYSEFSGNASILNIQTSFTLMLDFIGKNRHKSFNYTGKRNAVEFQQ